MHVLHVPALSTRMHSSKGRSLGRNIGIASFALCFLLDLRMPLCYTLTSGGARACARLCGLNIVRSKLERNGLTDVTESPNSFVAELSLAYYLE